MRIEDIPREMKEVVAALEYHKQYPGAFGATCRLLEASKDLATWINDQRIAQVTAAAARQQAA